MIVLTVTTALLLYHFTTPSEGRPHWGCHSSIPAVEVGRSAVVDSTAACAPRQRYYKDLSAHSGDHWARAVSEPWWGSCVSGWEDRGEVSGSEVG